MAMTTGVNERLQKLTEAGVSIWLYQIRRGMIETGELQRARVAPAAPAPPGPPA